MTRQFTPLLLFFFIHTYKQVLSLGQIPGKEDKFGADGCRRAYEQYPWPKEDLANHEVFLAGWGMPIGELFDLRELSQKCHELQQWTFFLTSMVLNVHAGIASPPNAQAIL